MVTIAVDSTGVTEPLVTADSAGLKVLRFELDTWIALFLGNSTDLRHLRQKIRTGCSKTLVAVCKRYYQSVIENVKESLQEIKNIWGTMRNTLWHHVRMVFWNCALWSEKGKPTPQRMSTFARSGRTCGSQVPLQRQIQNHFDTAATRQPPAPKDNRNLSSQKKTRKGVPPAIRGLAIQV